MPDRSLHGTRANSQMSNMHKKTYSLTSNFDFGTVIGVRSTSFNGERGSIKRKMPAQVCELFKGVKKSTSTHRLSASRCWRPPPQTSCAAASCRVYHWRLPFCHALFLAAVGDPPTNPVDLQSARENFPSSKVRTFQNCTTRHTTDRKVSRAASRAHTHTTPHILLRLFMCARTPSRGSFFHNFHS